MKTLLNYYGGKGAISNKILDYFPSSYKIYIEPFGGSGALLFAKPISPVEVYNDLNMNVYSLFKVVSDKDSFLRLKNRLELSLYSRDLREEYLRELRGEEIDTETRAYYFLYVNQTSYNGAGGFSCDLFNIRNNMSKCVSDYLSSIYNLPEYYKRLKHVIIENIDALTLIERYDSEDVFFYLDPPYHWSTRSSARYQVDMDNQKYIDFINSVNKNKKSKFLISGYDCEIMDSLDGFTKITFPVKVKDSKNNLKISYETLWYNYDINNGLFSSDRTSES